MIAERNPVVPGLPSQMRKDQQQRHDAGGVEFRIAQQAQVRQHGQQHDQRAVILTVRERCHSDAEPQGMAPAVVLGQALVAPQEQRGKKHQRTVGHGQKAVKLQDRHRSGDQDEQPRVTHRRGIGTDDPPQQIEVERLQQREEKPHAELSAPKTSQAYEQRRHRRMIEIAPRQRPGEHMVISLVVGQLGAAGLNQVGDPPQAQQQPQPYVGISRLQQFSHFGRVTPDFPRGEVSVGIYLAKIRKKPQRIALARSFPPHAPRLCRKRPVRRRKNGPRPAFFKRSSPAEARQNRNFRLPAHGKRLRRRHNPKTRRPPKTGPNALSFPNRRKRYAEQPKHVATAEKAGIRRSYPSFSKLFRSSISAGQRLSSGVSRISGMSSKRLSRAIKRKTVIPRKPSPRFR